MTVVRRYPRYRFRLWVRLLVVGLAVVAPLYAARAQATEVDSSRAAARPGHYWRDFAAGAVSSLLAHEMAHVVTAVAVGGHVTVGFDKGRPTVYSGLDVGFAYPHTARHAR